MRARLYVIPGSHPAMTARLMLERKGIDYERRDLIPVLSKAWLRAAGFPGVTVPALKLDGERVQGSREIGRLLDRVRPEPRLHPQDEAARAAVEAAERWGDEVLQPVPRRILWWLLRRDRPAMGTFLEGARLGVPVNVAVATGAPVAALSARFNAADDDSVRADLAALPGLIDHVDELIAKGVIGAGEPNAADLQIATSVRLLLTLDDLRPLIETRPAGRLALRLVPDYPGRVAPGLPAQWLPS
jgi:glutathione S-transferase